MKITRYVAINNEQFLVIIIEYMYTHYVINTKAQFKKFYHCNLDIQ